MKRLTKDEFYAVWERVVVENSSFTECRDIYRGLCTSDREELFMSVLLNSAMGMQIVLDKEREHRSKGGKHAKYKYIHDLAEKLYREDPTQTMAEVANEVFKQAEKSPKEFGLPASFDVKYRTIYDELRDRINEKK